MSDEEQRTLKAAERFGKLLVQEIALYNPDKVKQGCTQKNLYQLLKDEVDMSRDAFYNRYAGGKVLGRDIFREALIKFLANGDDSALGM